MTVCIECQTPLKNETMGTFCSAKCWRENGEKAVNFQAAKPTGFDPAHVRKVVKSIELNKTNGEQFKALQYCLYAHLRVGSGIRKMDENIAKNFPELYSYISDWIKKNCK